MSARAAIRSSTPKVLKQIRDNPGATAKELAETFGMILFPKVSTAAVGTVYMSEVLEELEEATLIRREGEGESASYRVTDGWLSIQRALGISLSELAQRHSGSVLVSPIFGVPAPTELQQTSAFVAIPFAPSFKPVSRAIEDVLLAENINPVRGDDILASENRSGAIMEDIWTRMYSARVVVADCTGLNANVMYELGMAHTLGTPVIPLTQATEQIPFDVHHLRFISYRPGPEGLHQLQLDLRKRMRALAPHAKLNQTSR